MIEDEGGTEQERKIKTKEGRSKHFNLLICQIFLNKVFCVFTHIHSHSLFDALSSHIYVVILRKEKKDFFIYVSF